MTNNTACYLILLKRISKLLYLTANGNNESHFHRGCGFVKMGRLSKSVHSACWYTTELSVPEIYNRSSGLSAAKKQQTIGLPTHGMTDMWVLIACPSKQRGCRRVTFIRSPKTINQFIEHPKSWYIFKRKAQKCVLRHL